MQEASKTNRHGLVVIVFARGPIIFQRDTQTISNAIDIGIIGCDLSNIQYRPVTETGLSQPYHIIFDHRIGCACQFRYIIQHRSIRRIEGRLIGVGLKLGNELVVSGQLTEVSRMMLQSVFAAINGRDHHANHLPLFSR